VHSGREPNMTFWRLGTEAEAVYHGGYRDVARKVCFLIGRTAALVKRGGAAPDAVEPSLAGRLGAPRKRLSAASGPRGTRISARRRFIGRCRRRVGLSGIVHCFASRRPRPAAYI